MVNAEGAFFGEYGIDGVIDVARGRKIIAQGFFETNTDILARKPGII